MDADSDSAEVVAGEAVESDTEDDVNPAANELQTQIPKPALLVSQVSGEASESDEEGSNEPGIPPLKVDARSHGDHHDDEDDVIYEKGNGVDSKPQSRPSVDDPKPYKYDTLLHRKLRERNSNLRRQLEMYKSAVYGKACKDIETVTQQLIKSQAAIQDVTSNMRLLTNDLFNLEDRIDIVSSCNILPDIKLRARAASGDESV